jgi:hypothetical protein
MNTDAGLGRDRAAQRTISVATTDCVGACSRYALSISNRRRRCRCVVDCPSLLTMDRPKVVSYHRCYMLDTWWLVLVVCQAGQRCYEDTEAMRGLDAIRFELLNPVG